MCHAGVWPSALPAFPRLDFAYFWSLVTAFARTGLVSPLDLGLRTSDYGSCFSSLVTALEVCHAGVWPSALPAVLSS